MKHLQWCWFVFGKKNLITNKWTEAKTKNQQMFLTVVIFTYVQSLLLSSSSSSSSAFVVKPPPFPPIKCKGINIFCFICTTLIMLVNFFSWPPQFCPLHPYMRYRTNSYVWVSVCEKGMPKTVVVFIICKIAPYRLES